MTDPAKIEFTTPCDRFGVDVLPQEEALRHEDVHS
jgi:hypothetical protein